MTRFGSLLFALALLLAPWAANAIEGCIVHVPPVIELPPVDAQQLAPASYPYIEVECEAGLPYQLELANALGGGRVDARSHHPEPIPVYFVQVNTRMPWGRFDQGEAIGGVGTGGGTTHPIEVAAELNYLPAPGRYTAPLEINLVF